MIDLQHMYLVVQDISLLENFSSTACFLEFSDEGVYTTNKNSREIFKLTQNFSIHVKLLATQEATARDIDFEELRLQYINLVRNRRKLSDLSVDIDRAKIKLTQFVTSKKTHYPILKKIHDLQEFHYHMNQAAIEKRNMVISSRNLMIFLKKQNELTEQLLISSKFHFNSQCALGHESIVMAANKQ